jgi:hypothetical protein
LPVVKRPISTEELIGAYLSFTPVPRQVALFEADICTLNSTLLNDSIRECLASHKLAGHEQMRQRTEIHRVYTRKTKELAALYPFVFATESALRSRAAECYGNIFGRRDWWHPIRDAHKAGRMADSFRVAKGGKKQIRGTSVSSKFVHELFYAFQNMSARQQTKLDGADKIDEFFGCLGFRNLWNIVESDWDIGREVFLNDTQLKLTLNKGMVSPSVRVLVDARNELFHSNPIKDRTKVYRACERILSYMAVHLGDFDEDLAMAKFVRTKPDIVRAAHHVVPARH